MRVKDSNAIVTEAIVKYKDTESICICPICEENIDYAIDDLETAYYCPVCENAVRFVEAKEGGSSMEFPSLTPLIVLAIFGLVSIPLWIYGLWSFISWLFSHITWV